MPGFRNCSWCHGKGCMCCEAEQEKWEKKSAAEMERRAKQDPRDRLRELQDPFLRMIVAQHGQHALDALDAEISEAQAACDAEYNRQFPDGPKPILVIKTDDPKDMTYLVPAISDGALQQAFGPGGGGTGEVLRGIEEAKSRRDAAD